MAVENKQQLVGLVSGSASTLGEIFDATKDGRLPRTELALVISSNPNAGSYERFKKKNGFDMDRFVVIDPDNYPSLEAYGDEVLRRSWEAGPDIVGQYGHTPMTPGHVIVDFGNNNVDMINQHPGPVDPSLWDFGGEGMSSAPRVHAARLIFVRETGRNYWTDVIAQRVGVRFDGGKVLKRGRVEILPTDTVDDLQERAIVVERQIQIETLRDYEEGKVEELPPYDDLVEPGERLLLQTIKRLVRRLYPAE